MAEIRRNLEQTFAMRREKALREAERRKQEVQEKIPELTSLDAKITLAGIRYARTVLSEKGPDSDANTLSEKISQLNEQKATLLLEHHLPADYMDPRFECPVCEDRGYITDRANGTSYPCTCYQNLYLEKLYAFSNLLDDGQTGFSHFNEAYFSETPDKRKYQSETAPRDQIQCIRNCCMAFIHNIGQPEAQNLYFFGPTGTGKTFMAKSVGLELLKKGYTVLYLSATSLFSIIRQYRLNPEHAGSDDEQAYKNLFTVNLLILDDLGTEPGSDARYAELLTLLELRKARDKNHPAKTIISSNLDVKRLFQEYNERIASRIVGEFNTLHFIGDDIRILKKIDGFSAC